MACIAILLTEGYREQELTLLRESLARADYDFRILGAGAEDQFAFTSAEGTSTRIDATFGSVNPLEFCGAIVPDGYWSTELEQNAKSFLRILHMSGRPIAAYSGGVRVLVSAGIGRGCTLSSLDIDRNILESAGVQWTDATMTTYGHIMSARGEENLKALLAAFLRAVDTFQKQTPPTEFLLETRPPS